MTAEQSRRKSISVLERCLTLESGDDQDTTRQQRLDELMAQFKESHEPLGPSIEYATGWHFCVPSSFRAALDIKLTPRRIRGSVVMKWTQGSWFHFDEGDTLYDSPNAYLPWNLNNFRICLDVKRASPAQPPNGTDRRTRYPGAIIFDILTPNEERTKLLKRRETAMSQDEFVRMLIVGPPEEWEEFFH